MQKPYKTSLLAITLSVSLTGCNPTQPKPETEETKHAPINEKRTLINLSSEDQLNDLIAQGNVIVDFYAEWCGPCKRLGPIIDELSKEISDVTFVKINIDSFKELRNAYSVQGVPTLIFFQNGKQISRTTGGDLSKASLRKRIQDTFESQPAA
jgi:thioredoxin 1